MVKIYANLIGNWVCLNDDENCIIGDNHSSPSLWWEENAIIYAPFNRQTQNTLYQYPYVNVHYKGKDYRINPTVHIQIVTES